MLQKVEMYTVVCDNCGEDVGSSQDYSCWNDEGYARTNAMESDWVKEDDKDYCPDCASFDDEDNLVLNPERKDKFK